MKTEYKILWIDDDHNNVRGDVRNISTFLEGYGIDLVIQKIEVTPDNCPTKESSFADAVSDAELDMVFIDFNMPEQGDAVISHIRKSLHHYHLPILFYTGDSEPEKILPRIFTDSLLADSSFLNISDGIYFCARDHISDKAKLILTSLLKKDSKPQRGRGLLMDRVSEIDAKIIAALKIIWPNVPVENQASVLKKVIKKLEGRKNRSSDLFGQLSTLSYSEVVESLINNDRAIDTHFRSEMLREMLRHIVGKAENGKMLSEFFNSDEDRRCLIDLRNDYAHKTGDEINNTHDQERCKYIRIETKRHLQNIKQLLNEA